MHVSLSKPFLTNPILLPLLLAFFSLGAALSAEAWRTPQPGERERIQIMDAMRAELARFDPQAHRMVFVVRELCLSANKGWVTVDPQLADGSQHYETLNASLKRHKKRWVVEELACQEEDCPPGRDAQALYKRINPQCR